MQKSMMMKSWSAGSEFSYLSSELPLGILRCTQVLCQLLILNSILYNFFDKIGQQCEK